MVFPVMNFDVYNPVGTAIDTGMGVSKGIEQLLASRQQRKQEEELHPFRLSQAEYDAELKRLQQQKGLAEEQYYPQMAEAMAQQEIAKGKYADPLAQADLAYKKSISDINALNYQISKEQDPLRKMNLQNQMNQAQLDAQKIQRYMQYGAYDQKTQQLADLLAFKQNMGQQAGGQAPGMQQPGMYQQQGMVEPDIIPETIARPGISQPETVTPVSAQPSTVQSVSGEKVPDWKGYLPQRKTEQQRFDKMLSDVYREAMMTDAQKAANKTYEEETAKQRAADQTEMNTKAKIASEINQDLRDLKRQYEKVPGDQKGWLMGHAPARNTAAQKLDKSLAKLIGKAQENWKGSLSEDTIESIRSQFPNRRMTPQAFNYIYDMLVSANERAIQMPKFYQEAYSDDVGATKVEADNAWLDYTSQTPYLPDFQSIVDEFNELAALGGDEGIPVEMPIDMYGDNKRNMPYTSAAQLGPEFLIAKLLGAG